MCYKDNANSSDTVTIEEGKKIKKKIIRENFMKMIGKYELL
jgi:hypothetical protein